MNPPVLDALTKPATPKPAPTEKAAPVTRATQTSAANEKLENGGPGRGSQRVSAASVLAENRRLLQERHDAAQHEGIARPSPLALQKMRHRTGWTLPSDTVATLTELQREWDAAKAGIMLNTYDAARAAHAAQERDAAIEAATNPAALESRTLWSKEEWIEESGKRMSHYKAAQKDIAARSFTLVQPFYQVFSEILDQLADQIEIQERDTAESLGVDYVPSASVRAIRRGAYDVRLRGKSVPTAMSGVTPHSFVSGMIDVA